MINEILVKGSCNSNINGIYKIHTLLNADKNTKSYYKDKNYQLYRYKNKWRIAHHCVKLYIELPFCENKEWDINELDLSSIESKNDKNDIKIINICFCSDVNLITFIPTVINSILLKNSKYKINIHYIHNIVDKSRINNLEKKISKYDNLTFFSYYKTWDRKYKGLKHVSVATMLRIFIPDLIKCHKIIYLDIDIIVNLDLNELYNINCGKTGIALKNSLVTPDGYIGINGQKNGNCGIIVMNLETLRKNNFTQKCLKIHSKNQDKHDQYIINMYAKGKHTVLKPRFNIFLNQDDYLVEKETEFILHYAGGKKPYYHNAGKYQYLWDENEFD